MRSKRSLPTIGYVLHETTDIVIIATLESKNIKTGHMVQIWILNRNESPISSVKNGTDVNVCFDCGHRGKDGFKDRTCYVDLSHGPQGIWHAYNRGRYEYLPVDRYAEAFSDRAIRFGAYGDPVLLPIHIVRALVAATTKGWTGYTHQWRKAEYREYREYLMASCDSAMDAHDAIASGWRYFRVRSESQALLAGEIKCPASPEGLNKSTCIQCRLCSGRKDNDTRKNIAIIVHGVGARNFVSIESITPASR